jgi:hypothetical protein
LLTEHHCAEVWLSASAASAANARTSHRTPKFLAGITANSYVKCKKLLKTINKRIFMEISTHSIISTLVDTNNLYNAAVEVYKVGAPTVAVIAGVAVCLSVYLLKQEGMPSNDRKFTVKQSIIPVALGMFATFATLAITKPYTPWSEFAPFVIGTGVAGIGTQIFF